jgi:predicted molibdopterin-dependent oxidoreductase YjgC
VQACNEVQVNDAIHFGYRGKRAKIIAGEDLPLREGECVFCGECVQACPTYALVLKDANFKVPPWEGIRVRTTCSYCGVGCQLWLHVRDNRIVKVTGVEETGPNRGSLCVKGRFGYHFVGHPDRLTTPLIREGEGFREASWDEALDLVAERLRAARTAGPQAVGVLASARIGNESNYLLQKLARGVLKSNNVDHCARL